MQLIGDSKYRVLAAVDRPHIRAALWAGTWTQFLPIRIFKRWAIRVKTGGQSMYKRYQLWKHNGPRWKT